MYSYVCESGSGSRAAAKWPAKSPPVPSNSQPPPLTLPYIRPTQYTDPDHDDDDDDDSNSNSSSSSSSNYEKTTAAIAATATTPTSTGMVLTFVCARLYQHGYRMRSWQG